MADLRKDGEPPELRTKIINGRQSVSLRPDQLTITFTGDAETRDLLRKQESGTYVYEGGVTLFEI